jgi:protein-S-isoprenylcysteine O-methyltransferase Ste14
MRAYGAIICGLWISLSIYWVTAIVPGRKDTGKTQRYGRVGISIGLSLALIFLLTQLRSVQGVAQQLFRVSVGPGVGILAVTLVAAGVGFAIWARFHLGRNWGIPLTIKQEPELVTSGPYKLVRHPIYTGFILAMLGSALVSSIFGLFLSLSMCAYFVISAFAEEKILSKHFPEQYPEYKKRSKMLIPFVI